MKFIWIEILKFIKNNIIKIAIGTTLIALAFVWINNRNTTIEIDETQEETEEATQEATQGEIRDENGNIEFVVDSGPGNFRFFVENTDGDAFTNNLLIEQYITRSSILEMAADATNTNLDELVEETENRVLVDYNKSGEDKIIGVARDGNSHLLEFHVNVGNEADNLVIADYYYNYISEENIPFISNKNMFVFHEPRIKEHSDDILFDSIDGTEENGRSIIRDIVIGIILGGTVSSGLLLLLSFLSKKLIYSFSYSLNADDYFFLVDEKLNYKSELKQLLSDPSDSNRIIVREDNVNFSNETFIQLMSEVTNTEKVNEYGSILDINRPEKIDRLIYVVQESSTSRDWYDKQRRLERIYEMPIVVIQVNKN